MSWWTLVIVTKEHGAAFSRQRTGLWQWTSENDQDAFELGLGE